VVSLNFSSKIGFPVQEPYDFPFKNPPSIGSFWRRTTEWPSVAKPQNRSCRDGKNNPGPNRAPHSTRPRPIDSTGFWDKPISNAIDRTFPKSGPAFFRVHDSARCPAWVDCFQNPPPAKNQTPATKKPPLRDSASIPGRIDRTLDRKPLTVSSSSVKNRVLR